MVNHQSLRLYARVFQVAAWVAVGLGVIGCVGLLAGGGAPETPRPVGLVVLVVGGLYFCLFSALSGIIQLLLAIEEQTRKTS